MLSLEADLLQVVIQVPIVFDLVAVDRAGQISNYRRVEEEPDDGDCCYSLVSALLTCHASTAAA